MVRKETCPHCKGNRYVTKANTIAADNKTGWIKCPACNGQGYRVRLT